MSKIIKIIKKSNLIENFIIASPIIDIIISFGENYGFPSIVGIAIRGLFLLAMVYYLIFHSNSQYKKKTMIAFAILCCFCLPFLANIFLSKSHSIFFLELKSIIKFFFFPIVLLCFINYYDEHRNDKSINTIKLVAYIYIVGLLVPLITNTAFNTYNSGKKGFAGWFYSANEVSSIISIITPVVFLFLLKEKRKIISTILALIYIVCCFSIGTKAPMLAIFITLIAIIVIIAIRSLIVKDKIGIALKKCCLPVAFIAIAMGIFAFSNSFENLLIQNDSLNDQNQNINKPTSGEQFLMDKDYLFPQRNYIYEYKTNRLMNMIFSSRDIFLIKSFSDWKLLSEYEKTFGIGFYQNSDEPVRLMELDFADILLHYGIVGFVVYFSGLIYVLFVIIRKIFTNFKKFIESDLVILAMSGFLGLIISFMSGHVLGAPAVSIYLAFVLALLFTGLNSQKEVKYSNKLALTKKQIILTVGIIFVFTSGTIIFHYYSSKNTLNDLSLSIQNEEIILKDNGTCSLNLREEDTRTTLGVTDKLQYYTCNSGNLTVLSLTFVVRDFANSSKAYYLTVNNNMPKKMKLNIDTNEYLQQNKYYFKDKEITKPFSNSTGYDQITLPVIYTYDVASLLVSKTYLYSNIRQNYGKNNYSTYKKLSKEVNDVFTADNKIIKMVTLNENQSMDTYFIKSENNLLEEKDIEVYVDMLNRNKISSWLAYNGPYFKLPYLIEPFTKEGYGRNLFQTIGKSIYDKKSLLFKDLWLSSAHNLYNYYPRHKSGAWLTEFTSTWLKSDYGITSLYVDTRHNENLGKYLYQIGVDTNNPILKKSYFDYADYLLTQYKTDNLIHLEEGILFPDYFSNNQKTVTHASLNHQLGIANYLFDGYLKSKNREYYEVAKKIITCIEKMGDDWIRENKDLWYKVDKNGVYSEKDYELVTLEDLMYTQQLLLKIDGIKSTALAKLINSKVKYLKSINYDIPEYIEEQL